MTQPTRFWILLLLTALALPETALAAEPSATGSAAAESPASDDGLPDAPFTIKSSTETQEAFQRDPETGDIAMLGYTLGALLAQGYAIHPDGRFLMIQAAEDEEERLVFIQNWRAKAPELFSVGGP